MPSRCILEVDAWRANALSLLCAGQPGSMNLAELPIALPLANHAQLSVVEFDQRSSLRGEGVSWSLSCAAAQYVAGFKWPARVPNIVYVAQQASFEITTRVSSASTTSYLGDGNKCYTQRGRVLVELLLDVHCMSKGEHNTL